MLHSTFRSLGVSAVALALVTLPVSAQGQEGCISLKGSNACPSFQDNYINPSRLAETWSFFDGVTDVASFDSRFLNYLDS